MTAVRFSDFRDDYDVEEASRRFTNHLRDEIAAMSRILHEYATIKEDTLLERLKEKESPRMETGMRMDEDVGAMEFIKQFEEKREETEERNREIIREHVGTIMFTRADIVEWFGWSNEEVDAVLSTMLDEDMVHEDDRDVYHAVPHPDHIESSGYRTFETIFRENQELYPEGTRGDGKGCNPFGLVDNATVIDDTNYVDVIERRKFEVHDITLPDYIEETVVENLRLRRTLKESNLVECVQLDEITGERFTEKEVRARRGWSHDEFIAIVEHLVDRGVVGEYEEDGFDWKWRTSLSECEWKLGGVSYASTLEWFEEKSPDSPSRWIGWRY